jgi:type I site-specific restriction-modification system R (restriction) subunit
MSGEFQMVETNTAMEKGVAQREMTEIQSQIAIAKSFPRDMNQVYTKLMNACSRKVLAEQAVYAYPRGKQTVSGPSIRLAEVAVQCFGNIDAGVRELEQKQGESTWEAYCYDLENNVKIKKTFAVKHERKARGRVEKLTDPRDIYEHGSNLGARRMRACILAVIPSDLIEQALKKCKQTSLGASDEPMTDRIRKMVEAFDKLQVTQDMIEKRLNHSVSEMDMDELFEYRTIYESLKNKMAKRADFFDFAVKAEQDKDLETMEKGLDDEAEELNIQPTAPKDPVDNSGDNPTKDVDKPVSKPKKQAAKKPAANPID